MSINEKPKKTNEIIYITRQFTHHTSVKYSKSQTVMSSSLGSAFLQ